jgi:hypothetical protein
MLRRELHRILAFHYLLLHEVLRVVRTVLNDNFVLHYCQNKLPILNCVATKGRRSCIMSFKGGARVRCSCPGCLLGDSKIFWGSKGFGTTNVNFFYSDKFPTPLYRFPTGTLEKHLLRITWDAHSVR